MSFARIFVTVYDRKFGSIVYLVGRICLTSPPSSFSCYPSATLPTSTFILTSELPRLPDLLWSFPSRILAGRRRRQIQFRLTQSAPPTATKTTRPGKFALNQRYSILSSRVILISFYYFLRPQPSLSYFCDKRGRRREACTLPPDNTRWRTLRQMLIRSLWSGNSLVSRMRR